MSAFSHLAPAAHAVCAEVAALDGMTTLQLQQRWSELFEEPCTSRNRAYLIKRLRYRIQERAFGGLSEAARQRILNLSQTSTLRHRPPREAPTPRETQPSLPSAPLVSVPAPMPPVPLSVDDRAPRLSAALAASPQLLPVVPIPTTPTPQAEPPADTPAHPKDPRLPPPGSVLRRVYRGRPCVVEVLDDGFRFEGKHFQSLSRVALHITGTPWNGFAFFKLGLSIPGV